MIRNKDIAAMWNADLAAFARWLTDHGSSEIIEIDRGRSIVFRADDSECVVVSMGDGKVKAWPASAKEACHAFLHDYDIDLRDGIEMPPVEDWHQVGREIALLSQQLEMVSSTQMGAEAARLGISVTRLRRALDAYGKARRPRPAAVTQRLAA